MEEFIQQHWLDITTTILGLAYIFLEYKVSIYLWAVGFAMQALDIVLYYDKGLYADCYMEFYYISMTIYGFINWKWLKGNKSSNSELPITHFPRSLIAPWALGTVAIWGAIWWYLSTHTNSTVPIADSFTTAFSFVGIWALARKHLEQWFIWIVVDVVTFVLYIHKDIPFKAGLYALYVIIAIKGYRKWKNMMKTYDVKSIS